MLETYVYFIEDYKAEMPEQGNGGDTATEHSVALLNRAARTEGRVGFS